MTYVCNNQERIININFYLPYPNFIRKQYNNFMKNEGAISKPTSFFFSLTMTFDTALKTVFSVRFPLMYLYFSNNL